MARDLESRSVAWRELRGELLDPAADAAEVPAAMEELGDRLHVRYDPLRGHPQHVPVRRWRATFQVALPAFGFQRLTLRAAAKPAAPPAGALHVSARTIENEFLRAALHPDGRFDLTDKQNGLVDWEQTGRTTSMGHAAYAADGSDHVNGHNENCWLSPACLTPARQSANIHLNHRKPPRVRRQSERTNG